MCRCGLTAPDEKRDLDCHRACVGTDSRAATAAVDKLGTDLVAYDVSEQLAITDVFLVVTASNERQVGAVVEGIEEVLRVSGCEAGTP